MVFKDPRKAPDLAAKYQLREGQTTIVLTRGQGDKENHTTVSVAQRSHRAGPHQRAAQARTRWATQNVYFTTGHGEWPLEPHEPRDPHRSASCARRSIQEGYLPTSLNLADGKEVPKDAALVVVAGAAEQVRPGRGTSSSAGTSPQGGRMLYFARPLAEPGLEPLLAPYGVQVDPGLVADDVYAVDSPYLVVSHFFGDTELVRDLKTARVQPPVPDGARDDASQGGPRSAAPSPRRCSLPPPTASR